jgi:hypothetical protein
VAILFASELDFCDPAASSLFLIKSGIPFGPLFSSRQHQAVFILAPASSQFQLFKELTLSTVYGLIF